MIEGKLSVDNFRMNIERWKQPYLKEVGKTATQFKGKVKQFRKTLQNDSDTSGEDIVRENQTKCESKQTLMEISKGEKKHFVTVENVRSNDPQIKLAEWKPSNSSGFKDYEDVVKNYHNVFQKKQRIARKKIEEFEDFRADERQMLEEIYQELKDEDKEAISFENIIGFFQNCDLFYLYYNIQPYRLEQMLKQFAHKYKNKLTKSQFIDFFLIDRLILLQSTPKTLKNQGSNCILSEQAWKSLKEIFDTLDTFGNERICIKALFQKIKFSAASVSLLSSHAIEFPSIDRRYTLEKIIFDLENKVKFDSKVQWETIEKMIRNFSHVNNPTIDEIFCENIREGKITKSSNYFLLEDDAIRILKQVFKRCPKYCQNFVKTNFFSYELLESGLLKPYFSSAAKPENASKNQYFTLEAMIKKLSKDAPPYMDLDEMLEYFSIKGLNKSKLYGSLNFQFEELSSSDEETIEEKEKRRLKKIKSMEDLKKMKKKSTMKKKKVFEKTQFKNFNLYEKRSPTIRERKVQEMIKEREMLDDVELNKKFKANPIPVTLNPQRYQKYAKIMQKKKQSILNRLNIKKESDALIIEYLKSNTKLFEERKVKEIPEMKRPKFEAKPLPHHISEELLSKIEEQKRQRRKILMEQTHKKYMIAWKDFLGNNFSSKGFSQESLLEKINEIEEKKQFEQIKAHQVPNFTELHKKFQEQLENRKKKIQPTEIKQFNLSSPNSKKNRENYYSPNPNDFRIRSRSPPQYPEVPIRSTKKYDDWVAYNQTKVAQREIELLQKQKEKEERLLKQKNFAKFMRKNLVNCSGNQKMLEKQTIEKLKNYRKYVSNLEKTTEEELARIYLRVLQKPFLFQLAGETMKYKNKEKPTKIRSGERKNTQGLKQYPAEEIFNSDGDQFHPMESQNLNQSY